MNAISWYQPTFSEGRAREFSNCENVEFIRLINAYRPFGGLRRLEGHRDCGKLAQGDEAATASAGRTGHVAFWWHNWWWCPEFCMRHESALVSKAVICTTDELRCVFVDLEIVGWFVQPSQWLDGMPPASLLELAPDRVLQAARIDRFVAAG